MFLCFSGIFTLPINYVPHGFPQFFNDVKKKFNHWHEFISNKRNLSMIPDLTPYATVLKEGKWVSKADFIYLIKSHYDSSDDKLRGLLRLLYKFSFHQIGKSQKGEILIQ
jgi:hypothetical protein